MRDARHRVWPLLLACALVSCRARSDAARTARDTVAADTEVTFLGDDSIRRTVPMLLRGAQPSAETTVAGYTIRCYAAGQPPQDVVVIIWDGDRPVWRIGQRGDSTRDMDLDQAARCPMKPGALRAVGDAPAFGGDVNGDGVPDVFASWSDGQICDECADLFAVSLARPLVVDTLAFTDSIGWRHGAGPPGLVMTDVSMNDLGASRVRPTVVYAWRGGHWVVAPDLMRTPALGAADLDTMAARIREAEDDDRFPQLMDAMARLVAGGHADLVWSLMHKVLTTEQERVNMRRAFLGALERSALRSLPRP